MSNKKISKKRKLAIWGAGGHARVAAEIALSMNHWSDVLIFDDTWPNEKVTGHFSIVGSKEELLTDIRYYDVFIGLGDNRKRMEIYADLEKMGATFATLVHRSSYISPSAKIGEGTIVMPGCVVNYGAQIGNCCIVNSNSTIEHDCVIHNGVHISPGATLGGTVTVGQNSWIGLGASIRHSIVIEAGAIIGAGSTVVKRVEENTTVVGSSASVLQR